MSVREKAARLGIESEYVDAHGVRRSVPEATLVRLVEALAGSGEAQPQSEKPLLWRQGRGEALPIGELTPARHWRLLSGETEVARGKIEGALHASEPAPVGVHRLVLTGSRSSAPLKPGTGAGTCVIVAPARAYQLEDVAAERLWVLAVQLYSVRSERNWGIGDFTDLRNLVRLAADIGASGIGLNPLHALFSDRPEDASPYAPNSRLFLNVLSIDPEAVPEFPGLASAAGLAADIARLRTAEEVDYTGVAAAKEKALRLAHRAFRERADPRRRSAFEAFRSARGEALARFAAFEVLRRRLQNVWWEWPQEWRVPSQAGVARVREEAPEEFEYYEYQQWIADEQLAQAQAEARRLGLAIGLYIDLAVGVEPGGADAWSAQESIVPQVEVGAPPDLLNTAGQAWGLAAFNPRALERQVFAPFMDLLESAMRHAGAIRLDHVLGLNRLYLIPFGSKPQEGAYVRYPLHELLAVVALQSVRHRCLIIGEDLGTVPQELRAILADWGIWSYLVMLFERGADAVFKPPQAYGRNALATFSTHDLPTFEGWRSGHDLTVKRGLGLDPGETDEERSRAHWLLGEALAHAGVSHGRRWHFSDIARFLARAPSRLMVVAIEDVLGVADQPNVPGTIREHPNWRQRLPVSLEELAQHRELRALSALLQEEGRGERFPAANRGEGEA